MNKKGQLGVGVLITIAMALIVGSVLLAGSGGIAANSAALTTTSNIVNQSFTMPTANSYYDIDACVNYAGTPIIANSTTELLTTNYTVTTRVSPTTGLKVLTIKSLGGISAGQKCNATFTCLPQGYSEESTARAISPLIILFTCLALLVIIMIPIIGSIKDFTS